MISATMSSTLILHVFYRIIINVQKLLFFVENILYYGNVLCLLKYSESLKMIVCKNIPGQLNNKSFVQSSHQTLT